MSMNKKEINNKGFSLVELIIVIAIMAILVGVLAPQFIKYVERSRQAADMQTIQELRTAIEVKAADEGLTANTSIAITGATGAVSVTGDTAALTNAGLATTATLKSTGWQNATYTFDKDSIKWTAVPTCENSKDPKYKMGDVFGSSTTAAPTT